MITGTGTESVGSDPGIPRDRYRVIRQLGRGGMATVYLCEGLRDGKLVALKIIAREYASTLTLERFFREIELLKQLDHHFIPKIVDTGIAEERPFFAMTYVEGETLRARLERESRLPVNDALRITRGILGPLHFAHSKGIVHRDIKPENVVLGSDGIYVLDFGIARAVTEAGGERLTKTGLTVGTPAYVSPEQALGERTLDQRSDIFSLGCVLYEMLAGAQPFIGATPEVLMARRFSSSPRSLAEIRDDIPAPVANAVSRAMSVSREDRWSTAEELASALEVDGDSRPTGGAEAEWSADLLTRLRAQFAGQFHVEQEMKGGGMSRLFLATDFELKRRVVIKILPPDLTSPMMLARFKRESEVTARLQHPNILPVISAGVRDGLAYYVMPFFEGESLRARLNRDGQLSVVDATRILCEITDALACAHEKGVIHRDIKPENILILGGHAVVADFGIASALTASPGENAERITGTGMSLGTVGYMAPEQALGDRNLDGRADIYSVGVVGYEMLTGAPPFAGATDQAILAAHLTREPDPVENRRAELPAPLSAAIRKALQKDPAMRFQSAREMHEAIDGSRPVRSDAFALNAASANALSTVDSVVARRNRSRWLNIGAPLLALVTIGSAGAYVLSKPEPPAAVNRKLAVLYFRDLSPQRELVHLADAFTEDLIEKLDEVTALDVVSKNGVQQVRQLDSDSAAKILGAGTLVEGTVEPTGDRYRVGIRITDGASGAELQRASFEYPAADPLSLREKLVGDVSDLLRKRLGEELRLTEWKSGTSDPQAWVLLQRGERLMKDAEELAASGDTSKAARRLLMADSVFGLSAARDKNWIEPLIMRGTVAFRRSRIASEPTEMSVWAANGLTFAESAVRADPRNGPALELRGTLRYWRWLNDLITDPAENAETLRLAEEDLRNAVRLAPHRASAWSVLSSLSANKADPIEAAIAARRAYEEDAYLSAAPDIVWRLYSSAYDNRQAVPAEHWCKEGAQRFPSNPRFVQCRLWLLTMPGIKVPPDSAWKLVAQLRKVTPETEWEFSSREAQMLVAAGLAKSGLADSARRVLVRARGDASVDPTRDLLIDEAVIRVIIGDKDEALRLLKLYLVAKPEHREGMAETQSWWWRDLKDDPRYQEMVGSAG